MSFATGLQVLALRQAGVVTQLRRLHADVNSEFVRLLLLDAGPTRN